MKRYLLSFGMLITLAAISGKSYGQTDIPDSSFSNDGFAITDAGGTDGATSVLQQPDGKIVVGGFTYPPSGTNNTAFVRYLSDGTLDTGFGNNGKALFAFNLDDASISQIILQPDGKIIGAGVRGYSTVRDAFLLRLNTNGTLDASFGTGGTFRKDLNGDIDVATCEALQTDGKILAGGYTKVGVTHDFLLMRLKSDGTLDSAFGINGIVITNVSNGSDHGKALLLQPDGKILLFGDAGVNAALCRYHTSGALDTSFGNNGISIVSYSPGLFTSADAMLQPDGKIVGVGNYNPLQPGVNHSIALMRFNANGSLDTSFGNGGRVSTLQWAGADMGKAAVLQSDGKIVVGGSSPVGTQSLFTFVRYEANGAMDSTFGASGMLTGTSDSSSDEFVTDMHLQADGKLLAAGIHTSGPGSDFVTARFSLTAGLPVKDHTPASVVLIYPNPASNQIFVSYTGQSKNLSWILTDAHGKALKKSMQKPADVQWMIDVASLPSGTYFLILDDGKRPVIKQILKP